MSKLIDVNKIDWQEGVFVNPNTKEPLPIIHKMATIEMLRDWQEGVQAIPIPKRATNGDMIEAMFPNCEQKEHMNNGYFEMYFDNDLGNASYMRISKEWWRAPYSKEGEK